MNREEAIDRLKGLFGNGYSKQEEALNMAIKALEQRPCEDAISRQAVLDILKREGRKWGNDYRDWVDAIEEIKNLSSVNPTKTGHWIMSDDGLYRPICDNCGAHPWKGYIPTVEEATEVFKYCPSCGSYNGGD